MCLYRHYSSAQIQRLLIKQISICADAICICTDNIPLRRRKLCLYRQYSSAQIQMCVYSSVQTRLVSVQILMRLCIRCVCTTYIGHPATSGIMEYHLKHLVFCLKSRFSSILFQLIFRQNKPKNDFLVDLMGGKG